MSFHEVLIDKKRGIVWINSGVDGSCIGRFSKRAGMDVHRSGTDQMQGKGECLHCTHGEASKGDWLLFIRLMKQHYNVTIKPEALSF